MNQTTFEGFEVPGTTPVPDIVFDELLSELTGNELKVLLYIIRRTYGFGKNADAISLSQFKKGIQTKDEKVLDKGCGIEHNRTILVALASLENKGYIIANRRQTKTGDADTTIYKLRFKSASQAASGNEVVTSGNHVVTSSNDGSYPTSLRWLPQVTTVVTPGNQQETVLQETVLQEESTYEQTRERESTSVSASASTPTPSSEVFFNQCSFCSEIMHTRCSHCGKRVCTKHGHDKGADDTWCDACLYMAESTPRPPVVVEASPPPSKKLAYVSPTLTKDIAEDHQRVLALFGMSETRSHCTDCGRPLTTPDCPWCTTVRSQSVAPSSRQAESRPTTSPPQPGNSQGAHEPSPLALVPPSGTSVPKRERGKKSEPEPLPTLTDAGQEVWNLWRGLFKREVPLTKADIDAAELLAPSRPTAEELKTCRLWHFATDNPQKPWYRKIGVGLPDVAKNWSKWQSLQDVPPQASVAPPPTMPTPNGTVSGKRRLDAADDDMTPVLQLRPPRRALG